MSSGESPSLDTGIPHRARVYDYWLGGRDNFAADREAGDQIVATQPSVLPAVRANRAFLRRAVQDLAGEAGIRQFLDVGAGLPTNENTHQTAQRVVPRSRIVYVDNDPIVLAHARALLDSSPEGATTYAGGSTFLASSTQFMSHNSQRAEIGTARSRSPNGRT